MRAVVVGLLGLAVSWPASAASDPPLLLRKPAVSRTEIALAYGGDLWIVPRGGGEARRLTSDVGVETDPVFSPDGRTIAFTGEYDGNLDVFVIPAAGGIPTRLTSHPYGDLAIGFTPDGKRVLFRSGRNSYSYFPRLFTVTLDGGLPTEVPLPQAEYGSFSPDGKQIAYVPFANHPDSPDFQRGLKRYRGGTASPIWIAQLADSRIEKIPRTDSDDARPMWVGESIYFLSDRDGPTTLYVYDTRTKQVRAALPASSTGEIKSASAGPDAIVYEQLGGIYLLELSQRQARRVDVRIAGDFSAVRPHWVDGSRQIQAVAVSPTGARAVFEARGEIVTVPAEHGDIRNLTRSAGAADRDPAWSPDGKSIAFFSDASGEYALQVVAQDGSGEVRTFDLGTPPSFFYSPRWSPDSKKIAFSDKRLNLWMLELAAGKPVRLDTNPFDGFRYDVAWSPDSKWIAYTRQLPSQLSAVFVYSLANRSSHQITDGMSDAAFPSFDEKGKYLFFTASTDVGPALASSMAAYKVTVARAAYLIVLRNDLPSPLAHRNDEEKSSAAEAAAGALKDECAGEEPGKESKEKEEKKGAKKDDKKEQPPDVRIDLVDIDQRVLGLPVPARNYAAMQAGDGHTLFLVEGPAVDDGRAYGRIVHQFDVCERKLEQKLKNVGAFTLTFDRKKVLYQQLPDPDPLASGDGPPPGQWFLQAVSTLGKPAGADGNPPKPLDLGSMQVYVDPRAEWRQIYREVWRIQRDFFYDPNLHGVDARALTAAFEPYLERIVSRGDLTYLLADMLGEISAQHIYIGGGERPEPRRVAGGLLGADYTIENDRYRFARIYRGENWNPDLRSPLTEPGVRVAEGDYLLAVNGRPLTGRDEIFRLFEHTAGKSVRLSVASDPGGKTARDVIVVPIADEESLRLRAWMDDNRRKVDRLSGGRLAYVYLPDTAVGGYTNFNRYYFAQVNRDGAVIDERFNGGGWIADYIVDWLNRPLLMMAMTREGEDVRLPFALYGPKVMLINELAGSGGDALPWMFRRLGIGPLVGTRTWGGLIGIGGYPNLIDGGFVTAPRWALYSPDGVFDVENKGVAPDHEVELDPAAWRQGRDPQLEYAVELVLRELRENPPEKIKRPPYPNYH